MNQGQTNRLEELRWKHELELKRAQLDAKLKEMISTSDYEFLSDIDSDNIQLQGDDWPSNKWEDFLYIQTPVENKSPVNKSISQLIKVNSTGTVYLFFMHYNFGLIAIPNATLARYWSDFIEIDGDEIFCSIPGRPEFICIEKSEDLIVGEEIKGMQWIYEVTFSSKEFKDELQSNSV
jgi:hypothetical protein